MILQTNLITSRERLLRALACEPVDRPPVWLMRQAGRALPEYRALKEKHTFVELVRTPELAAEVTLQPIRRYDFDAAILFSDILVVAEAMGQAYQFGAQGGMHMDFAVQSSADVDRLVVEPVRERLDYMGKALTLIGKELAGRTAMFGFAGSPWTLANFMMEGGSTREFTRAKALFYNDPVLYGRLMEKLTRAVIDCLTVQVDAGADAVQVFDSLGGSLAASAYEEASGRWITEIITALGGRVPVILFAKGVHESWEKLLRTGAKVLGVDWTISLRDVADRLPGNVGIQGNLDPALLCLEPQGVAVETRRILEAMRGRAGHVFNLGHGLPPGARLECIEALVNTVRSFR